MPKEPSVLCLFRRESDRRPPFASELEQRGWTVDSATIAGGGLRRVLKVFSRKWNLAAYDIIATNEYFLTWALCVRLLFHPRAPKLVSLSFNRSSEKIIRSGIRPIDALLNRIWRRVDLFLVHSRAEISLFSKLHCLDASRFVFSHWGYDLPQLPQSIRELPDEPYVSMVGRNNRDIVTFEKAIEKAATFGVVVTAPYMIERQASEWPKLDVLVDIALEDCIRIIAGSLAHVVLVSDGERGAGHISAVTAMLLGKPQIFSDVPTLSDYLVDGVNGIAVPLGDEMAVASAIRQLRDNPKLAKRLGETGRKLALKHMSHGASARRMAKAILDAHSGRWCDRW